MTLKIAEKAKAILKRYKDDKGSNDEYVFAYDFGSDRQLLPFGILNDQVHDLPELR